MRRMLIASAALLALFAFLPDDAFAQRGFGGRRLPRRRLSGWRLRRRRLPGRRLRRRRAPDVRAAWRRLFASSRLGRPRLCLARCRLARPLARRRLGGGAWRGAGWGYPYRRAWAGRGYWGYPGWGYPGWGYGGWGYGGGWGWGAAGLATGLALGAAVANPYPVYPAAAGGIGGTCSNSGPGLRPDRPGRDRQRLLVPGVRRARPGRRHAVRLRPADGPQGSSQYRPGDGPF